MKLLQLNLKNTQFSMEATVYLSSSNLCELLKSLKLDFLFTDQEDVSVSERTDKTGNSLAIALHLV